jgi:hypothetical protein
MPEVEVQTKLAGAIRQVVGEMAPTESDYGHRRRTPHNARGD